jgi:hypothetical protein
MDYTQTNPDHDQGIGGVGTGDGLDMDMVHDFGEGVGLDMRDFPVHDVEDGLEDSKHLGEYMNEVHAVGVSGYMNGIHPVGGTQIRDMGSSYRWRLGDTRKSFFLANSILEPGAAMYRSHDER